jgi:DNA-binding transcriptional ArsR family regulator
MTEVPDRTHEIRLFLLREVERDPTGLAARAQAEFGITRQAIARHIRALVDEGLLDASGQTRGRTYSLRALADHTIRVPLTRGLADDEFWRKEIEPHMAGVSVNVENICHYGFTEMFNNAIDHSAAKYITTGIRRTGAEVEIYVGDDGVGIFRKIRAALGLADERQAVFELTKGKLTTDPANHTGQGIFFSSRMFDRFEIDSHLLRLSHRQGDDGSTLIEATETPALFATLVTMSIDPASTRTTKEVFDRFVGSEGDYSFSTTQIVVALALYGREQLVSRSQAKRVMSRCENFRHVILDFSNVETIGPAFADEIFRVYANAHPEIEIRWVNCSAEVEGRIRHSRSNAS